MDSVKQEFYSFDRPMAKIHEDYEGRMYEQDKRTFGGLYYTNMARKLHIAVLHDSRSDFAEHMTAQDVFFHEVKYSWAHLNELQEAVNSLFGKFGVHASGFEPEMNRIYIGVDNLNNEVVHAIQEELARLGYNEPEAYTIREMDRAEFMGAPGSNETMNAQGVAIEEAEVKASTTTIMPGGMLVYKNASGGFSHLASINFGYKCNGVPFLVGAGHTCPSSYSGLEAYYVPYSGSGYPIADVDPNYNSGNRVKVGTIALRRLQGKFDLHTIQITQRNLRFTHTGYNGWEINSIGGTVTKGALLRVCGITTRYDAGYEYGKCSDAQAARSVGGQTITDMFQANFGANNGTSGGPVITADSNGNIRLVGLASSNDVGSFYAVRVQNMISEYSLSMLPAGTISV